MALGRWVSLSLPRRLMCDYMALSRDVPLIPMQRTMQLGDVVLARQANPDRIGWIAIFIKAYGLLCARHRELRWTYLPRPWGHFYEHPVPVAVLAVERMYQGEYAVLPAQIRNPGRRSLLEIHRFVQHCKHDPIEQVRSYRRALAFGRLPWFARATCYELTRWFGAQRSNQLGTFGLGITASEGASTLAVETPLTTTLHYGELTSTGELPMRLSFDHRVLDGAFVARVLAEFEQLLHDEIVLELNGQRAAAA